MSAEAFSQTSNDTGGSDVVVVQGFRGSLGAALDQKKDATGAIDAIVAEDIADFPDLNLAESLQRIPGVAITRSNGEGQNITVRGLSGIYTRTRINGMEARAATDGSTDRDFDFNLFAAELFNEIVVHKTASASLDEGSLGAVVDLSTARAFDFDEGFTFALNANAQYNTLSQDVGPRVAGLAAYNDPSGVFGATASIAYSNYTTQVNTGNTVRWQKASFNSVGGVDCGANPADAGCAEVSDAFHARIPRYGTEFVDRERLGITAGVQFQPTERTLISIDGMYATYKSLRDFKTIEVLFRGNEGGMDVVDYTISAQPDPYGLGNDTIDSMLVNNAWVRSESFLRKSEDDFYQITANIDHDLTDSLSFNALVGTTRSETHNPFSTTLMYDDRDYDGYFYDYRESTRFPTLAFNGPDVTDGTNFELTEIRDQINNTVSSFHNAEVNIDWMLAEALTVRVGSSIKKFEFDTRADRRDGGVCGLGLYDCASAGTDGIPGTAALSEPFTYDGQVGDGSTITWVSPSIDGWADEIGLYNVPLRVNEGAVASVEERNIGAYLQLAGQVPLGGMRLAYDAGVRYVTTKQESSGFNSGVYVTVDRPSYDDWLPSGNLALWMTDDFVVRVAGAKVMSRPSLGQLSPGGNVDSFNFAVNFQNPFLDPTRAVTLDAAAEWYFAPESLFGVAFFYKDISSFPIRELRMGTFASTGLPMSTIAPTSPASQTPEGPPTESCHPSNGGKGCWEISELTNGPGATVKGVEVAFQAPFDSIFENLPPIIENLGVIANFTYVDSDVEYNFQGNIVNERLLGLSNTSYNATLYYEDDKFRARISLANRSDYLQSGPNRSGNLWEFNEGGTVLDFSSTYSVTDNLDLSVEALNLTNTGFDTLVDVDARRRLEYATYGRTIIVGARYNF